MKDRPSAPPLAAGEGARAAWRVRGLAYLLCALGLTLLALRGPLLRALHPPSAVALGLKLSPPPYMKRYHDPWGREGDWGVEADVDSVSGQCLTPGPDGELGTSDDVTFAWHLSMLGEGLHVATDGVWAGRAGPPPPDALALDGLWLRVLAAPRDRLALALVLLTLWLVHAPWLRGARRSPWAEGLLHLLHLAPVAALGALALRELQGSLPALPWQLVPPEVGAGLGALLCASLTLAAIRWTMLGSRSGDDMRLGPVRRTLLIFLWLLPKNLISKIGGWFASVPWPGPLLRLQLRSYAWFWGVNMDEVRDPLTSFGSMQEFFVRQLKENARPIDPDPAAFVSPCDGAWGASGTVEGGQVLQVKGRPYSLAELLGSEQEAELYEGGTFATLYLSPKDYHRYHSPCAAEITHTRYLPGKLWPVNKVGVLGVDGLFAQNERIVCTLRVGEHRLAYIPVGATVVGKVKLAYSELTTNVSGGRREEEHQPPVPLTKGQEVGQFLFGSTVVIVSTPGLLDLDLRQPDTPCVLGRRIGTLLAVEAE